MKECSKSIVRRSSNPNFIRKYFVGDGVDIGGKPDPLKLYQEMFPFITSVKTWDLEDGDAQFMSSVSDGHFNFVHSSHCLEHLNDPSEGLSNWIRILAPNGYLIVTIPDEDLYEQGTFPSTFNLDHKYTFTIYKKKSWSKNSINVIELLAPFLSLCELVSLNLLDSTFRYELPRFDQTLTPVSESGIEFILRKRTVKELSDKGKFTSGVQPARDLKFHYNQYLLDQASMKSFNSGNPPFCDDSDL